MLRLRLILIHRNIHSSVILKNERVKFIALHVSLMITERASVATLETAVTILEFHEGLSILTSFPKKKTNKQTNKQKSLTEQN